MIRLAGCATPTFLIDALAAICLLYPFFSPLLSPIFTSFPLDFLFAGSVQHGRSASFASSLAVLPASLGSLRPVSRTARGLRAPHQFPLKSYGFPGAETARKRFSLWKMGLSAAKIAPSPPYTPPGTIKTRKGFGPLALSLDFLAVYCPAVFCAYLFAIPRKTRPNALDSRGQIGYNIAE